MKKTILISLILFLFVGVVFSQEKKSSAIKYIPSVGIHGGTLSYSGNIKGAKNSNVLTYWEPAYGFYLEKKINPIFGVSVNGLFGKVSKSELNTERFLNFETDILNFDLNLLLDFDNGKLIKESSILAPFLSVGVGFLSFDPKGDLYSNSGNFYNHWDDGTIRDVAQYTIGSDTSSNILIRDYNYESSLIDSTVSYSKTSITIPIRLGLKFEFTEKVNMRISLAYILTMTDYIDNVASGSNDKLIYTSFGLQYNFGAQKAVDERYKDFSFSELDLEDGDEDGVIDFDDFCQGTPKGVQVDEKGCALDGDDDGVPDYLDKELKTVPGSIVDENGVTIK